MASDKTPIQLHVETIIGLLNPVGSSARDRVVIRFGELGDHEWGCPRRILFEPVGGTLEQPQATGKIEVAENEWARPNRAALVDVRAHIAAESHAAMWVLWSNLIIASDSLGSYSEEGAFDLNPDDKTIASHLGDNARCMTQDFTWTLHLFDRIIALPPYGGDVTLVRTGDLVQAESFTNAQDFLDWDEADPE